MEEIKPIIENLLANEP